MKQLILLCDCRSETLVIEYDEEIKMADLAIFENYTNYGNKMSLWQRLRYCYQVLVHKKPYADQIVLNHNQLYQLKQFVESISNEPRASKSVN